MSCVQITHDMATRLLALRSWPDVNLEALRAMPEWKLAREWGWIMKSGELTGSGHMPSGGEQPAGIIR